MTTRRFIQCDVFSATPTKGNGLAVVVDGDGLSDTQMQNFAAWTNLSETTFLMRPTNPQADYKVRIFTTSYEMPFAGHPTLGSCAAWLASGHTPATSGTVVQECKIGLVEIDVAGGTPSFIAPPTRIAPLPDADKDRLIQALKLDPNSVVRAVALNNGPSWQVLELKTAQQVLDVDAGLVNWPGEPGVGLVGPHENGKPANYEVRYLEDPSGMGEDPITGSLNAAIARWMLADGRLTSDITMSQGTKLNREGRVFIHRDSTDADRVWIGGHTNILIQGTVDL